MLFNLKKKLEEKSFKTQQFIDQKRQKHQHPKKRRDCQLSFQQSHCDFPVAPSRGSYKYWYYSSEEESWSQPRTPTNLEWHPFCYENVRGHWIPLVAVGRMGLNSALLWLFQQDSPSSIIIHADGQQPGGYVCMTASHLATVQLIIHYCKAILCHCGSTKP